jgi:hypothetical protein
MQTASQLGRPQSSLTWRSKTEQRQTNHLIPAVLVVETLATVAAWASGSLLGWTSPLAQVLRVTVLAQWFAW